jgi:O-antigen/teichoic acid export membrane protein
VCSAYFLRFLVPCKTEAFPAESEPNRSIKATSLFGGVQVIQVILNLVRGKVIAVLLGAAGVGLNSLFISSVSMISNISGLGLSFTAVRDIAKAKESGDLERLSIIIKIFKRWLYATALLGFAGVLIFSPLLSLYTFKSYEYTVPFMFLAFMLLYEVAPSKLSG